MLQSRLQPLHPSPTTDDDAEELFTAFLPHLFPDEAHACLGDPGQTLLYSSPLYGDLRIRVPDYPAQRSIAASSSDVDGAAAAEEETRTSGDHLANDDDGGGRVEEERRLFAHYLWGGAMVVAEGIEDADKAGREGGMDKDVVGPGGDDDVRSVRRSRWNVKGQRVLELGAGAALPSLVAALAGAKSIAITDHPSSSALGGPIQATISQNIRSESNRQQISVHTHEWGILPSAQQAAECSEHLTCSASMQFAAENKGRFGRIICADCLWIKNQHENLVRSILWFLAPRQRHDNDGRNRERDEEEEEGEEEVGGERAGVAWVVAGFHTGREIVASFFETAVSMGLVVEDIWERDLNASIEEGEVTREWFPSRTTEDIQNRARWCVIAFLRKKE